MSATKDATRASLLCGAMGDVLGSEVEFLPRSSILLRYGRSGVKELPLIHKKGRFTDDTQMTLFTAWGLSNGDVWGALLDWYDTQAGTHLGPHESWLYHVPEMHRREAPGNTCLAALAGGIQGTMAFPINNSKGNGAVMRIAPAGLVANSFQNAIRIAALLGAMTHGHPLGWMSCSALAGMIYRCTEGESILSAAENISDALPGFWAEHQKHSSLLAGLLRHAQLLAYMDIPDHEAIAALGEGWVAEEALAMALCACLRYPDDVKACLRMCVNITGDSDSVAAIAGNLLGATMGVEQLPQDWLEQLELKDVIIRAADELFNSSNKEY